MALVLHRCENAVVTRGVQAWQKVRPLNDSDEVQVTGEEAKTHAAYKLASPEANYDEGR